MALPKVNYVDHQTVITAANMNNIQDAIIALEDKQDVDTTLGTCSTEASVGTKLATLTDFSLASGERIYVKFTYGNTSSNPTLNVNGTGAKPIMQYGTMPAGTDEFTSWKAGEVVPFVYDGVNWTIVGKGFTGNIVGLGYTVTKTY